MFKFGMNSSNVAKFLLQLFPCFITIIVLAFYALQIGDNLNLAKINVFILPLFFSEMGLGLLENINNKKALLLLSATCISIMTLGVNIWSDYQTLESFRLNNLSGWDVVWANLLFISICSTAIILIRLSRWSQMQWEIVRKTRQEQRLQNKDTWTKYITAKKLQSLNLQRIRYIYQQQLQEYKQKETFNRQIIKSQKRKERLKNKIKEDSVSRFIPDTLKIFGQWILTMIIVGTFFLFPYIGNGYSNWINTIKTFVKSFKKDINFNNETQYLFYYLLIYIITVSIIIVISYLIYNMVFNKSRDTENKFNLLKTYQVPIAILAVFGSFLYILTDGTTDLEWIKEGWQILLLIILFILVLFTAVEIVRLVITQCAENDSLLKKIISLIFFSILKFLSEILLSIISNFQIQQVISSLFSLILPISEKDETSFNRRLNFKLNHLFSEAIEEENKKSMPHETKFFYHHLIWRRHKNE